MPLAVGSFLVRQSVPFVRQGAQALGKDDQAGDLDGRLSGTGQKRGPRDADPVPAIQQLPQVPGSFVYFIPVQEALDFAAHVSNDEELGFAHVPNGQQAPRHGHLPVFLKVGLQLGGRGGRVKSCTIGIDSQLADFGELVSAHGNEFGFRRIGMCLLLFGHSAGDFKGLVPFWLADCQAESIFEGFSCVKCRSSLTFCREDSIFLHHPAAERRASLSTWAGVPANILKLHFSTLPRFFKR